MAKLGCALALASLSSLIKANAETEADLFKEVNAMQLALADQKKMLETNTLNMDNFDKSRRLQSTYVTKSAFDTAFAPLLTVHKSFTGALDSAWLCLCGALVMFMHAGFAMLETGSCRAKNASNVLMKNLVNVCVGTLGWWAFGWAFAYGAEAKSDGGNGFIGQVASLAGTSTREMIAQELSHLLHLATLANARARCSPGSSNGPSAPQVPPLSVVVLQNV